MDRHTLLNYEKKKGYEQFFSIIKAAKDKILAEFIDHSLDAKNTSLRIFLLKNNHGYRDQQEIRVSDQFDIEF